ncbi:MAG: HAD hydrolase family protein [Mycoplasmoidaceae bacterium]
MANETTHKKLVVFDINLDWNCYKQEDRRYKDLPLVYPLIRKAYEYQTVVILTSGCLTDALDFVNTHEIKKGYLVASGGAIIYDIENSKILEMHTLDHDDIHAIVHHGIMNFVNVTVYTPTRKFIYVSNDVGYNNLKNLCYSQHEVLQTYDMLQQTLSRTDIVDIGYLMFLGPLDHPKQRLLLYNLEKYCENEVTNLTFKTNNTSKYVHIGTKNSTKLKAVEKLMALNDIKQFGDVLYIAASCINSDCYISFKNSLIASNNDFFNEIGYKKNHKFLAEEINKLDPEFGKKTGSFWK